jgi:ribosomal protein S18 acetylase RimI-like enzyme
MIQNQRLDPSPLTIRTATANDIPFLAWVIAEASIVPPSNDCFWDDLLEETGIDPLSFLQAALKTEAWLWGKLSDFRILEENGQPVAGAAGYAPNLENYQSINLAQLDAIAEALNWDVTGMNLFLDRYEQVDGKNLRPDFLKPQAPWIIETVAVRPEARGRGLAKILLRALLEEGRSRGYSHAGIMVINGHDRAQRVYESLGFRVYVAYGAEYFDDEFPGLTKFRRALT